MKNKIYTVSVNGCDDSTIFDVWLTQEEYKIVKNLCFMCTEASEYGCQPTMDIKEK